MVQEPIPVQIVHQRMPHVECVDAVLFIEAHLEGKDAEHLARHPAHEPYPAPPPCPELGGDVEDHRNAGPAQALGETEVEIGGIHQDSGPGVPPDRLLRHPDHQPPDAWQLPKHLGQPHVGQLTGVGQKLHAGVFETISTDSEAAEPWHRPGQGPHQVGGMDVPGDFARDHQELRSPAHRGSRRRSCRTEQTPAHTRTPTAAPARSHATSRSSKLRQGTRPCSSSVAIPRATLHANPAAAAGAAGSCTVHDARNASTP